MAQTGRVVLHTSPVKASLLLLVGVVFLAVGVIGLMVTLDGDGNRPLGVAWFGFIILFGLAGVVASIVRLARPARLIVEPHQLMWGPNVIPWAWVGSVDQYSLKLGSPKFLYVRFNETAQAAIPPPNGALAQGLLKADHSMFGGPATALPPNLNGRIKDQLAFLREVHAWSHASSSG